MTQTDFCTLLGINPRIGESRVTHEQKLATSKSWRRIPLISALQGNRILSNRRLDFEETPP